MKKHSGPGVQKNLPIKYYCTYKKAENCGGEICPYNFKNRPTFFNNKENVDKILVLSILNLKFCKKKKNVDNNKLRML